MQYRYMKHTQDHRIGDVVEYDTDSPRTRQLVERGFIVASQPVAENRETKPSRKKRERKDAAADE